MNLNIGCSSIRGLYGRKEWINLDLSKMRGVNVIGKGDYLPFANESFDEIHTVHVLEHLTRDRWPIMLEEMYRVLKVGGEIFVEVPDFPGQLTLMRQAINEGNRWKQHLYRTAIYGKTERSGMAHHFGFGWGILKDAFITVGFVDVERKKNRKEMISGHWRDGPVILAYGRKDKKFTKSVLNDLTFDELRKKVLI